MSATKKWIIGGIILAPTILGLIILALGGPAATLSARKIGVVRIADIIYASEGYIEQLREFRADKSIAGVLLRIDSPGGAVAPSQEIYAEVLRYRDEHKPLVVSMGNVAASGGYYIASPAERIFANPGTITGSIGVILQFPQYADLLDKIGVDIETIKAGDFKDAGDPSRPMTAHEREYLRRVTEDTHEQFIEDVSRVRSLGIDSLRMLADGRIFTGRQARALGLIDSLGGYSQALQYLRTRLGLSEQARIVQKKPRKSLLRDILFENLARVIPAIRTAVRPAGSYFLMQLPF